MTKHSQNKREVDINEVMGMIPHRYPFLMIDKVVDIVAGESATGVKGVTVAEPHFQGHFPGQPIMPGVLIVEAMAQAGAVLLLHDMPERADRLVYFAGIDGARFRHAVTPGDRLTLTMQVVKLRSRTCKMSGRAEVDGKLAAEAEILSAMVER